MARSFIAYILIVLLLVSCGEDDETPVLQSIDQEAPIVQSESDKAKYIFFVDDSNNPFVIVTETQAIGDAYPDILDFASGTGELSENFEVLTIISSDGFATFDPNAIAGLDVDTATENMALGMEAFLEGQFGDDWILEVIDNSLVFKPNSENEDAYKETYSCINETIDATSSEEQEQGPQLSAIGECIEEAIFWPQAATPQIEGFNTISFPTSSSVITINNSSVTIQPIENNSAGIISFPETNISVLPAAGYQNCATNIVDNYNQGLANANYPESYIIDYSGYSWDESTDFYYWETVGFRLFVSYLGDIVDIPPYGWEYFGTEAFLQEILQTCLYQETVESICKHAPVSEVSEETESALSETLLTPQPNCGNMNLTISLGNVILQTVGEDYLLSSLLSCIRNFSFGVLSTSEEGENFTEGNSNSVSSAFEEGGNLRDNGGPLLTACLSSTGAPDLLYQLLPNLIDEDPSGDFIVVAGSILEGRENDIGIGGGAGTIADYCIPHPILGVDDTLNDVRPAEFINALNSLSDNAEHNALEEGSGSSLPCNVIATSGQVGDGLRARASANEAFASPEVFADAYSAALSAMRFSACAESRLGYERRQELEQNGFNDLSTDEIQQITTACVDLGFVDYSQPQLFVEMSADPDSVDSELLNSFIFESADQVPELLSVTYVFVEGNLAPIFALDTSGSIHSIEGVATSTTGFYNIDDLLNAYGIFVDEKINPLLALDESLGSDEIFVDEKQNPITLERGFTLVITNDEDLLNSFEEVTHLLSDEDVRNEFEEVTHLINVFDFAYNVEEFAKLYTDDCECYIEIQEEGNEITDRDTGRVDETPLDDNDGGPSGDSFLDQQPQEVIDCAMAAVADFDAIFNRERPPTDEESALIRECVGNGGSR
jgi:hypothetical protein